MNLLGPFYPLMYQAPLPGQNEIFQQFFLVYFKIYWIILSITLTIYGISRMLGMTWIPTSQVLLRSLISSILIYLWPNIVDEISVALNYLSSAILHTISLKECLEQIFAILLAYLMSKKQLLLFLTFYGIRWYAIVFLAMAIPCSFPLWILGYRAPLRALLASYISLLSVQVLNSAIMRIIGTGSIVEIPLSLAAAFTIVILPWFICSAAPLLSLLRCLK